MVFLLFFLSGFTALVYQVLWMKELGLLFGNTIHAAATTLSTFFIGLMTGSYFFGKNIKKFSNCIKVYSLLEFGIAFSALFYFLLLTLFHTIYSPVFNLFGAGSAGLLVIKICMSVLILSPAAFFMGGTFPVMSHYLVSNRYQQGAMTSALYATNTLGAMFGAFMAGFYLPVIFGFKGSYLFAVCITLLVGLIAWHLSRIDKLPHEPAVTGNQYPDKEHSYETFSFGFLVLVSFISGFSTIGLEVIWTRMFAQVLQNSVYTFSMILVLFLFAISAGAWLTHIMIKIFRKPDNLLFIFILLSALAVSITPALFMHVTDNLQYIGGDGSWGDYVVDIFLSGAAVILVPGILTGTIFPMTLKLSEPYSDSVGKTVGYLTAINTLGAILGSVFAGFVLFGILGLWNSIGTFSLVYAVLLSILAPGIKSPGSIYRYILALISIVIVIYFVQQADKFPVVFIEEKSEKLVEVWEGNYGTTAVINHAGLLKLKVNNYYTLGGVPSSGFEERQTQVPVLLHPNPNKVFFLGMGAGLTAGTSLLYPVKKVDVVELVPEAILAARKHFNKYLYGLFEDERVSIIAEDGRNYLAGTNEKYDLIISDLFIPWKAGTGTLYTREHYEIVLDHLQDDGLFVQWMPMYQVSEQEFGIVVRTMLDVFPLVTLWRGGFMSDKAIMGIIGHKNNKPVSRESLVKNLEYEISKFNFSNIIYPIEADGTGYNQFRESPDLVSSFMLFYAGNLSQVADLFKSYQINTDNFPVIEYLAPRTHRAQKAKIKDWFVNEELISLLKRIHEFSGPETDLFLVNLTAQQRQHYTAGLHLHEYEIAKLSADRKRLEENLESFRAIAMPDF